MNSIYDEQLEYRLNNAPLPGIDRLRNSPEYNPGLYSSTDNDCSIARYFDTDDCRLSKLAVDRGAMTSGQCISACANALQNSPGGVCPLSTTQSFCNKQPTVKYIYTFHPDPIIYKWQLGNRNWADSNLTYINPFQDTGSISASPCIYDSIAPPYHNQKDYFTRSYKYMTRLEIPADATNLDSYDYDQAEDCGCTELKTPFGYTHAGNWWVFSVCGFATKPKYILDSMWFSINSEWIKNNVSESQFETVYLNSPEQNWFSDGFKNDVNTLCSNPSVSVFMSHRTAMDKLYDKYFFNPATAQSNIVKVTKDNFLSLPNFCDGNGLNDTQRANCEISRPGGQGEKVCGCSNDCLLVKQNRCLDTYNTYCKDNSNCLQCIQAPHQISPGSGPLCSDSDCDKWTGFCDSWDDMKQECKTQCGSFCKRKNLCRNKTAQDRAANATDLDTACPYNDQPVFSQFCKDFITDKVCN